MGHRELGEGLPLCREVGSGGGCRVESPLREPFGGSFMALEHFPSEEIRSEEGIELESQFFFFKFFFCLFSASQGVPGFFACLQKKKKKKKEKKKVSVL